MELLKQLYGIHSPSGKEKEIRTFRQKHITRNIPGAHVRTDKAGNLFVAKGRAESYPCLVAHMDQVQQHRSRNFTVVETDDILFGYSPSKRRYEGLGADDKNGIWIALKCLEEVAVLKVVFFVEEEIGCRGNYAADIAFFNDCRFVVEADRRGHKDLIVEIGDMDICSQAFIEAIQPERFGYAPADGMMTDIEALHDNGIGLSCVNVSCGYYEPHTDHEFTVKKDLLNCLALVQHIIEHCTEIYTYRPTYHGYNLRFDDYDFQTDMMFDIMMAHPDYTPQDAWDTYCMNFPELSRNEFLDIYANYMLAYDMDIPKQSALR